MKITEHAANSHTAVIKGEKKILLCSDVHFDSKDCHRELLKEHFEEADYILIFGDLFDVMGCHRDPRSKGADVKPEYLRPDRSYLDLVVEDVFNFLLPFKDKLLFMSYGNHETAITKHRDTDILNTLVFLLRQAGSPVVKGGYSGFFNVLFHPTKGNSASRSYLIGYHHGGGGNAPRSKGILHMDMDFMEWPDVDLFVSGHNHQRGIWSGVCKRRGQKGDIYHQQRHWVKTGTYKRHEKQPGIGGWAVEKKFPPTPIGGIFLTIGAKWSGRNFTIKPTIYEAN